MESSQASFFQIVTQWGRKLSLLKTERLYEMIIIIAECLNTHFVNITDSIGIDPSFKINETDLSMEESIDMALAKYKTHPSIAAIKKKYKVSRKFEFNNVDLLNIMNKIEALSTNKSSNGNIPIKIIRDTKEVICPYLTSCINVAINKCYFPDKLKEADVSAIHKNGDKCQKTNCRPISILPGMSKIFGQIMNEQINQHFIGILSPLLSGF